MHAASCPFFPFLSLQQAYCQAVPGATRWSTFSTWSIFFQFKLCIRNEWEKVLVSCCTRDGWAVDWFVCLNKQNLSMKPLFLYTLRYGGVYTFIEYSSWCNHRKIFLSFQLGESDIFCKCQSVPFRFIFCIKIVSYLSKVQS